MKAWILSGYGDIGDIAMGDIDTPKAGAGEVLVRVAAAACNPADVKVVTGKGGGTFLHAKNFPFAIGFDFSGQVEALGDGVSAYQVGDEVFGFLPYDSKNRQGSFAQYLTIPAAAIGRKPAAISHQATASAATTASTALQGLRDLGGLAAGQRVLINGASGGVGSFAVQLAKREGAEVWATCSGRNMDYVTGLGADRVIDYRETPLAEVGRADGEATRFDIVFDAASVSSFGACAHLLSKRGAYITLLPSLSWATGKLRSLFSGRRCHFVVVKARSADLDFLAEVLESGDLVTNIAETYATDDVPKALQRLADGKVQGKLAVTIDFADL